MKRNASDAVVSLEELAEATGPPEKEGFPREIDPCDSLLAVEEKALGPRHEDGTDFKKRLSTQLALACFDPFQTGSTATGEPRYVAPVRARVPIPRNRLKVRDLKSPILLSPDFNFRSLGRAAEEAIPICLANFSRKVMTFLTLNGSQFSSAGQGGSGLDGQLLGNPEPRFWSEHDESLSI